VSWVLIGVVLFVGGAWAAATVFPHVGARFTIWLHALDPAVYNKAGGSWQLVQGLFGMANGGLFGTGWGQGRPDIVTFAQSDFIVTSLGEELGLTGLVAILVLYAILTERGMRTAIGVRDGFGKLLAGGLAFVVAFQVFVVVGGVTRIIPLTGLTTPLLAYGGSSLLANWIIVALLLRVSDDARRPAPVLAPTSGPTPVVPAPAGSDQPTERLGGVRP
jgi:cell division protein FtsW (lipid II flippase)